MISLSKFDYQSKRNKDGSGTDTYYTRWNLPYNYGRPWTVNIISFLDKDGKNVHGGWVALFNSDRVGVYPTPEDAAQAIIDKIIGLASDMLALKREDFIESK